MENGRMRTLDATLKLLPVVLLPLTWVWAAGCASPPPEQRTPTASSTLIDNATVFDGSGAPRFEADVRIDGDRIVALGHLDPVPGETVVDATGLALAPGFIDTHSHADADILERLDARAAVSQGITTVVGGADGESRLPLAEFFARLEQTPAAVNVASFAGHNTFRDRILGADFRRLATDDEIEAMSELLVADLEAGALGLSTGLEYDPGIFSSTEEVIALARHAARYKGRYTSHMRSEDREFWQAIDEILRIGREAEIPINLTHLKLAMQSSLGRSDRLLTQLDQARASGMEVTADVYPYTYWQSTLEVLFPARDFDNLASARFAITEVSSPEGMLIAEFRPEPELVGQTLAAIAMARQTEPAVALMDLIREAQAYRERTGEENVESVIATSMSEADIDRILQWPWINICTDGELRGSHPRGFGSFTRILGRFVRQRQVLSLEEAIHKMTDRAALNAGLPRRARIELDRYADLVLFDPATVADRATTDDPHADSSGISMVWVNGELVWSGGDATAARPGRVLRRPGAS